MNLTTDTPSIQVTRDGPLGHLVLCDAGTLNALTLDAIKALRNGLAQHEADPQIKAIVISSQSERAFCAGGQMKSLRKSAIDQRFDEIDTFFENEYGLNLAIANCSKPYIALIDGIAMGGGLGISVHGFARVVTERAVLAMPESRIGFFPDVGASYFLQTLPQRAGYWLGLTAAPLKAGEAVIAGLATHYVAGNQLPTLLARLHASLQQVDADDAKGCLSIVTSELGKLGNMPTDVAFEDTLAKRKKWFADSDLNAIRQRLIDASNTNGDNTISDREDAQQLLTLLDAGSPYSARITLELFQKTKGQSLENCLKLERQLANEACRHPDFVEGIRSVLVDKDRNPCWKTD